MNATQARWGARTPSGWVVGRVAGAPVVLAPSWLLVAAFLTYLFVPTVRAAAPGLGSVATIAAAAGFPLLLAASVLLHELGHGLTARRLGIPVTEYVVTLWGGHTQFGRDLPRPGSSAVISLAGPLANGVLGLVFWWAAGLASGVAAVLLAAGAVANAFVAVFNLLPGLPLDGGRVLEALVWWVTGDRPRGTVVAAWAGRLITLAVGALTLGIPLAQGRQPDLVTAVTVVLVGAFLWTGAGQAIRGATVARQAEGLDLLALAAPAVTMPLGSSVAQVDAWARPGSAVVLVADDGAPVALVDPAAAASVPGSLRAVTGAGAVARPLAPTSVVTERWGMPAVRAMAAAQRAGPVAVLVDAGAGPPLVLGVVPVVAVAQTMTGHAPP